MTTITSTQFASTKPTGSAPPLAGFGNIFAKEVQEWFHTRRFLVTSILTSALVGAVPVIVFLYYSGLSKGRLALSVGTYHGMVDGWNAILFTLGALVLVALMMGILIKEEESGTAQWVFTKPVSRVGYGLAKWLANSLIAIVAAVLIPSAVFLGLTEAIATTGIHNWSGIFGAIGLTAFYVSVGIAVIMALSSIFRSQALVAGIAIGMIFLPFIFQGIGPARKWADLFPIMMGEVASFAAQGRQLPPWEPVVSSLVILPACVAFACYRLSKKQLQ